jgi:hypothetical protein
MLTPEELAGKDPIELENLLRSRHRELGAIRARYGGTLVNVSTEDAGTVRRINGEMTMLGEAIDVKRAESGADRLFEHVDHVLNDVAEDGKIPGHPRGRTTGEGGTSGREIQRGGSLYEAMIGAGWKSGIGQRVSVGPGPLYAAVTVTSPVDTLSPSRLIGTIGLGSDQRYIWPALKSDALGALDTGVDYLQETARALADPATMRRALTAVSAKPESAVTVELKHATLYQLAHVISDVPNLVFRTPQIRSILDGEMRLGLAQAIDKMVIDEIAATTIPAGATGGTLAERIRKAVKAVQDAGHNPDTLAINSQGSLDLDLLLLSLQNSTGISPSWNLRVRVAKSITGSGLVFDSTAFGTVHLSPVEISAFEQDAGQTNKSRIRGELNGRATIEVPAAAATVAAT